MPKIILDIYHSYLKMIENSIGARLFQNLYINDGTRSDAVRGGRLSCAFFVSSILNNFGLLKEPHARVESTLKDMQKFGWFEIKKLRKGAVLLWEAQKGQFGIHKHLGFYLAKNMAISNSSKKRVPVRHHWTFGKKSNKSYRRIIGIYWHKKLDI